MTHSGELADCDAATSRSSAKRVAGVVSKFSDLKKKLVCDIGFDGILHMPQINKTPRKFTVWLLSKVHIPSKSIVVEGRCKVKLTDKAFQRVLGIPCGPKKLVGLETNEVQDKIDFVKLAIGSIGTDPLETCCQKVAEDVVTMDYQDGMTKEQEDRFKVSFVVFVVGHFLVAKTKTNHGMEEYWGSLLNSSEIHLHNFCSLVIDEILESVKRVQDELGSKRSIKNVTGCTLGLQVLYLDNLKLSGFILPPDKLPRVSLFDLVLLEKMINADQENNISYLPREKHANISTTESHLGKRVRFEGDTSVENGNHSKVDKDVVFRSPQPAVSSYLTAYLRGSIEQKVTNGQVDALKWHNARMTYHVRRTKDVLFQGGCYSNNQEGFKTMIEVHMEALMAKIFQDNLCLAQRLHSNAPNLSTPCNIVFKGSSYMNVSSDYYSNRSEGQSPVGAHSCNESGGSRKTNSGNEFTPIVGNQLFAEDRKASAKKIKQESGMSSSDNTGNKSDQKPIQDQFILSEDAITAILEQGSRHSLQQHSARTMSTAFKKLICRQKKFAPDPWKYGKKKRK